MRPEAEIQALVADAIAANLEGADALIDAPLWALRRAYNGCGPEWMPECVRDSLTRYLAAFEPAFLVHDWDTSASDGEPGGFYASNRRLWRNCRALANRRWPWYNWRRYAARLAADTIYDTVNTFGWHAWYSASEGKREEVRGKREEVRGKREEVTHPLTHSPTHKLTN